MSGNQTSDIKVKLKKLREEEKILVKLLQRVNEQLNSLRVEEIILRRHLRSDGSSESMFTPDLPITDGTEQTYSNAENEIRTEATLDLDVDEVLRSMIANGQGNYEDNQQEVEEEEDEEDEEPLKNL